MNVQRIKEYINENNLLPQLLEDLGCHSIKLQKYKSA